MALLTFFFFNILSHSAIGNDSCFTLQDLTKKKVSNIINPARLCHFCFFHIFLVAACQSVLTFVLQITLPSRPREAQVDPAAARPPATRSQMPTEGVSSQRGGVVVHAAPLQDDEECPESYDDVQCRQELFRGAL